MAKAGAACSLLTPEWWLQPLSCLLLAAGGFLFPPQPSYHHSFLFFFFFTEDSGVLGTAQSKKNRDGGLEYVLILFIFIFFIFSWQCHMACRILVPQTGIEPIPLALEVQRFNPLYCHCY